MPERATVLMPVYNAELYVKEAIQSILDQTFTDYSFLIINDGSTDGSEVIIKSFNDPRIQYIKHETNRGLIATLNEGLEQATGDYIIRMDADDVSFPNRFEKQVAFMDANPDIAISGTFLAADNNKGVIQFPETPDACKVELLRNTVVGHPSAILRREAITKKELKFDGTALHAEDYKFWAAAAVAGLKIANIPEALVKYREHDAQVSSVSFGQQNENTRQIRAWYIRQYFDSLIEDTRIYYDLIESVISKYSDFQVAVTMVKKMKAQNRLEQEFDIVMFDSIVDGLIGYAAFRIYVLCMDCNLNNLRYAFDDPNFYAATNILQRGRYILKSFKNVFS